MVPGAGAVGGTSPTITNSFSGGTHESPDTPFCHVSATQGPEEAHGLHLLVPGAGAVGGTSPPIKKSLSGGTNESADASFAPVSAPHGSQEAIISHNWL